MRKEKKAMQELQKVEYESRRVLTTMQLAEGYDATEKMISNNFIRNKERFIEGKHYYELRGEDLKSFKEGLPLSEGNLKFAPSIYLWTERGALHHAKILDTEKAWEVYERLEETYFRVKQNDLLEGVSPELQAILLQDKKLQVIETKVTKLEDNIHITRSQQKQLRQFANEVIVKALGGKYSNAYKELAQKAFNEFWKSYKNHFDLSSYLDTSKKDFQLALQFINDWKPSRDLDLMIKGANIGNEVGEEE